jgi:hypothetical protein
MVRALVDIPSETHFLYLIWKISYIVFASPVVSDHGPMTEPCDMRTICSNGKGRYPNFARHLVKIVLHVLTFPTLNF